MINPFGKKGNPIFSIDDSLSRHCKENLYTIPAYDLRELFHGMKYD